MLYKLWEGSWDDDAVIFDREHRRYADPAKVRYINHKGENFQVEGPHLCEPSRQRTPLLYQATGSPRGVQFAGRHAEVVFTGGRTTEAFKANVAEIRAAAVAEGRTGNDVKFVAQAGVIVGRNDLEVADKLDAYRSNASIEGRLVHSRSAIDYLAYPPEEKLSAIIARKDPGWDEIPASFTPDQTVGEVLAGIANQREGRFFVAGTPSVVADEIEKWLDEDDLDGINLRQYHTFDTARDFIELVVPELRRRGRYRDSYDDGETLRERVFGPGLARLPQTHRAARYRGGANLESDNGQEQDADEVTSTRVA